MKKRILAILVLLGLGIGAYAWYQQENAARVADSANIVLYGNVDIRDVRLGFRVPGRIAAVSFEEGDRVRKGDVVAVLDKQTFTDEVELCAAQLELAEVSLRKVEMPLQRRNRLTKMGAISTEERDDAEAVRDEALAQVRAARARLQQAMTSLADTEILSPDDGVILTRVREPGAVVAAGETVYSLALDSPVWIRAYIDEPRLGYLYPGQKAVVLTDSGHEHSGQIGFISPQAEFTPKTVETTELRSDLVYRLRIIMDNPDKTLRQGMPVTVRIAREQP